MTSYVMQQWQHMHQLVNKQLEVTFVLAGMGAGMSQEDMLKATVAGAGPQRPANRHARRALKRR